MPLDVLDHDDGIIYHEAHRDRQSHQREVVEAVAEFVEHREGADQRQRHGDAGMMVAQKLRRNRKITMTTSATVSSNVNCTSATEARMVSVRSEMTETFIAAGIDASSTGSMALIRATVWMTLAPGWRWMPRMIA